VLGLVLACARSPVDLGATYRGAAAGVPSPTLPLDPEIRHGTLPNGLRWFAVDDDQPPDELRLRLIVRAGSVLEDDDQLGAAHLVEHVAFDGTPRMPGPELTGWLDHLGAPWGPHVDAHAAFDETTFDLRVPPDDAPVALRVLRDWAAGLRFDGDEVDAVRGALLREWLERSGPQRRLEAATTPVVFHGSPYASRPPGGPADASLDLTPAAAARFYRDWYRPGLMAVIAVGAADPTALGAAIAAEFADLADPPDPRPRPDYEIPADPTTRYLVLPDADTLSTAVQVLSQHDDFERTTIAGYRADLVQRVGFDAVGARFARDGEDSPLRSAGAGKQRLTPSEGADVLAAATRPGRAVEGYRRLLDEIAAVRTGGFDAAELADAVDRVGAQYDALLSAPVDDQARVDELTRVFLNGEAAPGRVAEVELAQGLLPSLTVDELDAWGRDWMRGSRIVMVVGPPDDVPPEEILRSVE
jgi:zinc protease